MHKVCAAGRYAPNKQSTNNTNSTKKSQPGLTKVSPQEHPSSLPFLVGFVFVNLDFSVYFVVVDF